MKYLQESQIQDNLCLRFFLTLHLQNQDCIVIHFRMTGTLTIENINTPPEKHTHIILNFTNGKSLRYIDSRGFGHWWYFNKNQEDTSGQLLLGPEPQNVTLKYLQQKFKNRQCPLKSALLDQHIIAGIGNIYADEILLSMLKAGEKNDMNG